MYDYLIITPLPSFYKVNLYNALAKKCKIYVIFIADQSQERTHDFVGKQMDFPYKVLNDGNFETRSIINSLGLLLNNVNNLKFKKFIISGWDLPEYWALLFLRKRAHVCLALESTIYESRVSGMKGVLKNFFLSRVGTVFASGTSHEALLKSIGFNGKIFFTRGVGIINKPEVLYNAKKEYSGRFLFLGRLSPEKNIEFLLEVFKDLKDLRLSIIGEGPLEKSLKNSATSNVVFLGHVENTKISNVFIDHDVLILPSLRETWGLVVEEALYHGLPVIISRNSGAAELITEGLNGFTIDPFSTDDMKSKLLMLNSNIYKKMRSHISRDSINLKDTEQVEVYIKALQP